MSESYFEIPIFGLTSDTKVQQSITINLNSILPPSIRDFGNLPNQTNLFEFSTGVLQLEHSRSVIVWRTPVHDRIIFHDLHNGTCVEVHFQGLHTLEYIAPNVSVTVDEDIHLFFGISSGILFKISLPGLSQSSNPLACLRAELFKYKKSVFVLSNINIITTNPNTKLHGLTQILPVPADTCDTKGLVFTRDKYKISLWQIESGSIPTRFASTEVHSTRHGNSPKASFLSSIFGSQSNQEHRAIDTFDTEILSWSFSNSELHICQNDGLYRRWRLNNNDINEIAEFNVVGKISLWLGQPDFDTISSAKIFPEENFIVIHFENVKDGEVHFAGLSISDQEWVTNGCIDKSLDGNDIKTVMDFCWDSTSKTLSVLQKDEQLNYRVVISDETFSKWSQVELSTTSEKSQSKILEHLSNPNISDNYIDTDSISSILNECYQIDTGSYLATRENLIHEIKQRFLPKRVDQSQANMSYQFISNLTNTTLNKTSYLNETLGPNALYDLYRNIVSHEDTQNIPFGIHGNLLLHQNRIGYIFSRPESSNHKNILPLYEKLIDANLSPHDFLDYDQDAYNESQPSAWDLTTTLDQLPQLDHLKHRLKACLQLHYYTTLIKDQLTSLVNDSPEPTLDQINDLHQFQISITALSEIALEHAKPHQLNTTDSSMDDIDLSCLVINQAPSLKIHNEKCMFEMYLEQVNPSFNLFPAALKLSDKNTLSFLHYLNDTGRREQAKQLLDKLQTASQNPEISSNNAYTIMSSIIISNTMDCEEIIDLVNTTINILDSSNLYVLDGGKSLDIQAFYESNLIEFLQKLNQPIRLISNAIKIIFLLQYVALLEQIDTDAATQALLQVCEITLIRVKEQPFMQLCQVVKENTIQAECSPIITTIFYDFIPLLHSKMFVHYLKLSDYKSAYEMAYKNPEKDRKLNSLRHLICYLCERNETACLTEFMYDGCLTEVHEILISRAKASDLFIVNNSQLTAIRYYEILASLLIKRGELYNAAKIYIEISHRLKIEPVPKWMDVTIFLDHIEKALLPAVMLLSSSDKTWVAQRKVVLSTRHVVKDGDPNIIDQIVTLDELKQDLARIQKLKLLATTRQKEGLNNCPIHVGLSSEQIIRYLCEYDLYDDAIELADMEGLDFDQIVRNLSNKVAFNLTTTDQKHPISKLTQHNCQFTNLVQIQDSRKWEEYLKSALDRMYKIESETRKSNGRAISLYEITIRTFISNAVEKIPSWLVENFGPDRMIRIYTRSGRIEEAALSLMEIIDKNNELLENIGLEAISKQELDNMPWTIVQEILSFIQADDFDSEFRVNIENSLEAYVTKLEDMDRVMAQRKMLQTG